MILLDLTVLLCIIPLTVLLAVCVPVRFRPYVLAAGGMASLLAVCGVRGLLLTLISVCMGWLCLRLQKTRSQNRRAAAVWLTAGAAAQAVLLPASRLLLDTPSKRIPLLLCILQAILCIRMRFSGQLSAQPLPSYVLYQCTLPRLIGGPVLSYPQAAELSADCRPDARLAGRGALHCTAGLAQLSMLAAPLFSMHRQMTETNAAVSAADTWLLLTVFYCAAYYAVRGAAEFCRGLAALTGYRLPAQCDTPLRAKSPADFCRRWYRSAEQWCKTVLLSGASSPDSTAYFARVLLCFCGIGLMLGRGWAPGLLWGVYMSLILTAQCSLRRSRVRAAECVSRAVTALLMLYGCCFLQAATLSDCFSAAADLIGRNGILPSGRAVYAFRNHWLALLAAVIGLLPLREAVRSQLRKRRWLRRIVYVLIPPAEAALLLLCLTGLLGGRLRG